jgi:peptide chain release factor 2
VDTFRAIGAGGQHINKTSTAIRITHIPTNTVVQCQNEAQPAAKQGTAMRMLRGKLLELQEREREEQMNQIKGEMKKIEWGSRFAALMFQPYTLVKDHRTGAENGNIQAVMDGEQEPFNHAYLVQS